jgi:hypothetical protein
LDHRNLTNAQRVLFELDTHACCYLINALSFDLMKRINYAGTAREIWESIKHTFGDSPHGMMASSRRRSPRRRCMSVLSMTIIR